MTPFHYEAPSSGEPQYAINTALHTLLPLDFRIIEQTSSSLIVEGPGYISTRQNALLGMSRAEFAFSCSTVSIKAEMGGVERMGRFLLILLMGMGLFDAAVFTGLWLYIDRLHAQTWFLAIPALVFIPWIFIAPWMTRWIGKRCEEAVIRLVDNCALTAHRDQF